MIETPAAPPREIRRQRVQIRQVNRLQLLQLRRWRLKLRELRLERMALETEIAAHIRNQPPFMQMDADFPIKKWEIEHRPLAASSRR